MLVPVSNTHGLPGSCYFSAVPAAAAPAADGDDQPEPALYTATTVLWTSSLQHKDCADVLLLLLLGNHPACITQYTCCPYPTGCAAADGAGLPSACAHAALTLQTVLLLLLLLPPACSTYAGPTLQNVLLLLLLFQHACSSHNGPHPTNSAAAVAACLQLACHPHLQTVLLLLLLLLLLPHGCSPHAGPTLHSILLLLLLLLLHIL
jgi:hypothetical protein